jgi:hypothetical protein
LYFYGRPSVTSAHLYHHYMVFIITLFPRPPSPSIAVANGANNNPTLKRKALGGIGPNTGQTTSSVTLNNANSNSVGLLSKNDADPNDIEYIPTEAYGEPTVKSLNVVRASDCGFTTSMNMKKMYTEQQIIQSSSSLPPIYKNLCTDLILRHNHHQNQYGITIEEEKEIFGKVQQETVRSVLTNSFVAGYLDNTEYNGTTIMNNDDNPDDDDVSDTTILFYVGNDENNYSNRSESLINIDAIGADILQLFSHE